MAVSIRGKTLPLPIVQGGMGIGVSLERLAGAVAANGGMGTLSAALCGFKEPDFRENAREANPYDSFLFNEYAGHAYTVLKEYIRRFY